MVVVVVVVTVAVAVAVTDDVMKHTSTAATATFYPARTTRTIEEQLTVACQFLSLTNLAECSTITAIETSIMVGTTIPTEIGLLTQFTSLILNNNTHLMGTIPSTLGNLVQLTTLGLFDNQLTGPIATQYLDFV